MAVTIQRLVAYEITDSSGNPTIEIDITLSTGVSIVSSASSDTVINTYGKRELRDHDMQHYQGLGVKSALGIVNQVIGPKMVNMPVGNLLQFDDWLKKSDNTEDCSKLGVNTMVALSQAFAKASASSLSMPVYRYINGYYQQLTKAPLPIEKIPTVAVSLLAGGNQVEFDEIEAIPSSSLPFSQAYEMCVDLYHGVQLIYEQGQTPYSRSTDGALTPQKNSNTEYIESILDTVQRKGLKLGKHVFLGLKVNGKNFYNQGKYNVKERPSALAAPEFYNYLSELIGKYSVLMVEDPFATEDIDGWKKLFVNLGEQIYIVGNKYIGDKIEILDQYDHGQTITSVVIKPTYFGTITETIRAIHNARSHNMAFVVTADKSETDDDFIADFAMGVQADFIKFGAPVQGERVAKYNRLLKIEQEARMSAARAPSPQSAPPAAPQSQEKK